LAERYYEDIFADTGIGQSVEPIRSSGSTIPIINLYRRFNTQKSAIPTVTYALNEIREQQHGTSGGGTDNTSEYVIGFTEAARDASGVQL
jgi:hypothetical protein